MKTNKKVIIYYDMGVTHDVRNTRIGSSHCSNKPNSPIGDQSGEKP